ncbi:MAG: gliding motility-associated C-terminal domain-containing protein [Bacteroidales bacterium]|nr:gliding motility-associated C-terminal domain-containing protein [Bacteroidales bacterium]MCF8405851.1 gliding motility-associated C-terminal domain-containing protein [Bacteroidales bacterium]
MMTSINGIFDPTLAGVGLHQIIYLIPGPCGDADTLEIIVHEIPDVELGVDTIICVGDTLVLNPGSFFENYLWQDGSQEITFYVFQPGEYWVQVMNEYGCFGSDTILVDFSPLPEVDLGNDTLLCAGDTLVLNAGSSYSEYLWQDGSQNPYYFVTIPGTYWVMVTNENGCSGGDTIQVDFAILPEIDLGPDTVLCEGESLVLDVDPSFAAYLWQDGSEESTYEVTQPGEYWVMVTNEIGCTGGDTIQVDFAILPDVNLGNDTTICEGDSLIIFAGDSYEYYEWQDGSSGQSYIAKEEGLYWVIVTLEGCTKKDSLYLSVEEATLPIYLGSDTTICKDEYITIGINPGVNLNYLWSTGDTTAAISIGQPGTYSLEVFGACGSSSDAITISNWPYPNPALGDDRFLCFGQFDYLIAAPGFYSYSWNNQSPTSDNEILVSETNYYYVEVEDYHGCIGYDTVFVEVGSIVELGEPTIDLCEGDSVVLDAGGEFDYYNWNGVAGSQTKTIFEGGIYKVEVGYSANAECTSEDQVTVNYFNLPVAVIISGDFLCEGDTLHLKAPIGSYTYYWNNEQSNNALFIVNSGGNYTLKLENVCGFDSTEKIIEQRSLPNVNLGEDRLLFPDESITLDAGVFESYEWNNDSNLNSQFYTVTSENAVDTSTIFVEVFDGLCYNKDDVFIEVFYVKIPAVITPNGDGDNDTFEPFEEGWAGIHEHTISVFNRWGEKVWESNDFPSGWDGKQNGRYVAEGTYYWILEVKYGPENLSKSYKGSLTVIGTGR